MTTQRIRELEAMLAEARRESLVWNGKPCVGQPDDNPCFCHAMNKRCGACSRTGCEED